MTKNKKENPLVEILCRIRPQEKVKHCSFNIHDCILALQIPKSSSKFRSSEAKKSLRYKFTNIFDQNVTQKFFFDAVGLSLVQDLLAGKNSLLFSYGSSGSGKTYGIIGNENELGLLQMSLDTLFNSISFQQAKKYIFKPNKMNSFDLRSEKEASQENQHKKDYENLNYHKTKRSASSNDPSGKLVNCNEDYIYAVFVSCVEIYNKEIYDLLSDLKSNGLDLNRPGTSLTLSNEKKAKKNRIYKGRE